MAPQGCRWTGRAPTFARATRRYWLRTLPRAHAERDVWWRRAEQIPNHVLRDAALKALLSKSDILEGAVAFAAFSPPHMHAQVVRAITAFEVAFDYLDTIVELPNPDPIVNGRSLYKALLVAFEPDLPHLDYYEHHTHRDDAGYLRALVGTCQAAIGKLPSFAVIAEPARRALSRIMVYQSLNHGDAHGSYDAFAQWARSQSLPGVDLRWWEIGAATGSQLSVLALIAAAADPAMRSDRAQALERSYFPWIAGLSTLLDSVIDRRKDALEGQRSLVDHYSSPQETAERLGMIAGEARRAIQPLVDSENHVLILAAMAAFFHSTPQAASPDVGLATRAVLDTMGGGAIPALLLFKTRRALTRRPREGEASLRQVA
jgi:tetraprenyl-beta-curcumene synthase